VTGGSSATVAGNLIRANASSIETVSAQAAFVSRDGHAADEDGWQAASSSATKRLSPAPLSTPEFRAVRVCMAGRCVIARASSRARHFHDSMTSGMVWGMVSATGASRDPGARTTRARVQLRAVPALAGVALLVIYARFGDFMGFQAFYGDPGGRWGGARAFLYVAPAELRFWLAHLTLALPGVLLLAWGLAPRLAPAIRRLVVRVDSASPRDWRWASLAYFALLFALSMIGRRFVLLDMPFTDDENGVVFGARMLAEGHWSVPRLEPAGAFNDLFTYQRGDLVSAMDFPGQLLFGAAALATGLGGALYSAVSAAGGIAVAFATGRWLGPRARVLAALIWIASPMALSLSITSHGHVTARAFVAIALAFAARVDTAAPTPRRDATLLGVFAGLGFLCRPFESALLLAPLAAWLVFRALRTGREHEPRPRRVVLSWMIAGFLPSLVLFAWYNVQITGVWYLQARFAPGVTNFTPWDTESPWDRAGFNLGFNLIMLAVWFLGVPALAAVVAALQRKRPIMLVLAVGVVLVLLLSLAHDNVGVHAVGPIHYSECAVPLTILATAGMLRGFAWLSSCGVARAPAGVLLAGYLVGACGLFSVTNMASLHEQARLQRLPFDALADLGVHKAIVIAPPFWSLVRGHPLFAPVGSWVLQYPHPDPFLRDDVIFVRHTADPAALRSRFPERTIYVMTYNTGPRPIQLSPLGTAAAPGGRR
jgi:hypothetical protein